jgi:indolepyruvate ferredoxin oxidoreductase beta subunit
VATGVETYPDDILDTLRQSKLSVLPIDAFSVAQELGEPRAVNMVIVGSLSYFLPIKENIFINFIKERLPEKIQEVNLEAF